jgi:long-chain acyl-CoA synthetase
MTETTALNGAGTFPRVFLSKCLELGDRAVSIREKDYGIWQSYTWRQAWEQVEAFANGLAALGFRRGDRLCVVGDNRPQLYWAMLAAQCLGGVPVPLYQDSIEREMQYIVHHAEARFAIVEDQEQVDKFIAIKPECPTLAYVIYKDPRGLRNYKQDYLLGFGQVQEMGRKFGKENPDYVRRELEQGQPDDLAVICYTSGTTGRPKGVMLSHANFLSTSRNIIAYEGLRPNESLLAYLPMAWVGDFFLSFAMAMTGGFTVNCPESSATVTHDLREIGPSYFFGPPRIWENLLTGVMIRMDDAAWPKRKLFHAAINHALKVQSLRNLGKSPGLWDRLLYFLGNLLIYAPVKDRLGLSRVRIAYTAGEAIGPEIFDFFRALGINLKQLYGMTEASVFVSLQKEGQIKSDTCGPPVPWVKVRISPEGEVQFQSPGVFKGYFKNDEATQAAFDGPWYRTGDAGFIDGDGHLKIIDRFKDVSKLADGTLFAPKYIENKLKFSHFIREAVAFGPDRPYVAVMVNIDAEAVGNWAERRNLTYTSYADLARKPEVHDLVAEEIRKVNQAIAADEQLKGAQIQRFLILQKELDPDDEEITRTRKVRRGFIAQKYKQLIDALYSDAHQVSAETKVTFEDGRTAMVKSDMAIRDVPTAA